MNKIQKIFFILLSTFSLVHARSPMDELMRKQYFTALNQQARDASGTHKPTYTKNPDGTITVSCTWDITVNTPSQLAELKKQAEEKIEEEKAKRQAKSVWRNMLREAIEGLELNMSTDTLFTKCVTSWEPNGKKTISCTYTAVLSEILSPTK